MVYFNSIKIPIAPTHTQQKIIEDFDKLKKSTDSLLQQYLEKMDNLEELKKSILQKAFNGELT